MSDLYEPLVVGALQLKNRVVMAPLTRNRSPDAIPTELAATYYSQRAGAGLLISEATAISPQGQGYADVPGLYGTEQLDGWKRVTDAVHEAGGLIACQLWHVGRISHNSLQPDGQAPVAPSAITAKSKTYLVNDGVGSFAETSAPRALDAGELPGIVQDFRHAARNAIASGFDAVEVHAANGYLIDQFLKTGANQRTDDYGGSVKNRARLLLEILRAVTEEIGADRTGVRFSPVTPANDIVDADPTPLFDYVARQIGPMNLAFVHVIEGATGGPREVEGRPFDFAHFKQTWRDAGGKGAWIVNNGYDKALAEAAVDNGAADAVAFGRPYIANPDLAERLRAGAELNTIEKTTLYGGGAKGYTDYPALY